MKSKLIFFYAIFFNLMIYCQVEEKTNYKVNSSGVFLTDANGVWLPRVYKDETIKGSVYLNDNWNGKNQIRLNSGEGLSIPSLNYNLVKHTLESKISNDSVFQINPTNIDYIKINNNKYKFYSIEGKNILTNVLYMSPKVTLIKVTSLLINKSVINPLSKEVISEASYSKNEKYMIRKGDELFKVFELKERNFLKFFDKESDKLIEFKKNKKLNFNSEKDIFSIFEFYDSI